ncbi:MAG: OsmC family protein [Balneolales bacterium]
MEKVTSEQLRAIQSPLKEKYLDNPDAAVITLHAEGQLGEGVSCSVETGKALVQAGLHPATGGTGLQVCSGDMLLQALVACSGVTMNAVATALDIEVYSGKITAEGDLDLRGTLGVDKETPVGFKSIRLQIDLKTDAPDDKVKTLLKLTKRYCVVYQTLRGGVDVVVSMVR